MKNGLMLPMSLWECHFWHVQSAGIYVLVFRYGMELKQSSCSFINISRDVSSFIFNTDDDHDDNKDSEDNENNQD